MKTKYRFKTNRITIDKGLDDGYDRYCIFLTLPEGECDGWINCSTRKTANIYNILQKCIIYQQSKEGKHQQIRYTFLDVDFFITTDCDKSYFFRTTKSIEEINFVVDKVMLKDKVLYEKI